MNIKRAFTLIELLVVIAIIAILAAILFPVFAQAKTAAKITQSLSSMKQMGMGNLLYAGDNDDNRVLRNMHDGQNEWSWKQLINPYVKNTGLFKDPINTAARLDDFHSWPATRAYFGWATTTLPDNQRFKRGYVLANIWGPSWFADASAVSLTSFANVADVFSVIEQKTIWSDMGTYWGWVEDNDSDYTWLGPAYQTGGGTWNWGSEKWGNKAFVAAYWDGHAKRQSHSASCGKNFLNIPAGEYDNWNMGDAAKTAAGNDPTSWMNSYCYTLPAKFK